jgi:hypothetical protein
MTKPGTYRREHVRHERPSAPSEAGSRLPSRPPLPDDAASLRAMRLRVDRLLGLIESRGGRAAAPRAAPAGATDDERAAFWRERAAAAAAAAGLINEEAR